MRLRDRWNRAGKVIEEESDERTELASLRILRPVLGAVIGVALLAAVVLLFLPLSGHQRAEGWELAAAVVIFTGLITLQVSSRRQLSRNPELEAAAILRGSVWIPVGAIIVGVLAYGLYHSVAQAAGIAVALLIGMSAGLAIRYWQLRRRR